MTRLYEMRFIDDKRIQLELFEILDRTVDILSIVRKSLLVSAYHTEDRRKLINKVFKESNVVHVHKKDLLWACFSPDQTSRKQHIFRSFIIKQIEYRENRFILTVDFTYEKSRRWLELKEK